MSLSAFDYLGKRRPKFPRKKDECLLWSVFPTIGARVGSLNVRHGVRPRCSSVLFRKVEATHSRTDENFHFSKLADYPLIVHYMEHALLQRRLLTFLLRCLLCFGQNSYTPSQADVTVFKSVDSAPSSQYPHALRWYKHIASYEAEFDTLAGEKSKSADDLIPAVASTSSAKSADAAPAAEDDDDEVDLFGSDDDEVDEAAEKLKQERLAAYAAKKATKPKTIAKVRSIPVYTEDIQAD